MRKAIRKPVAGSPNGLKQTTIELEARIKEHEQNEGVLWIGSLERLRLRTEEQKKLNDEYEARRKRAK